MCDVAESLLDVWLLLGDRTAAALMPNQERCLMEWNQMDWKMRWTRIWNGNRMKMGWWDLIAEDRMFLASDEWMKNWNWNGVDGRWQWDGEVRRCCCRRGWRWMRKWCRDGMEEQDRASAGRICGMTMAERQNFGSKIREEMDFWMLEWLLPPPFIELRGGGFGSACCNRFHVAALDLFCSSFSCNRPPTEAVTEASWMAEKTLQASRDCQLGFPGSSGDVEKVPVASNGVKICKRKILFRRRLVRDDDEQ